MEVIISDLSSTGRVERKVDIFEQVFLNWDVFYEYLWEHRNDIRKLGEEWRCN